MDDRTEYADIFTAHGQPSPFIGADRQCDERRDVTAGGGAWDTERCQLPAGHEGDCEFGGLN